MKRLRSRPRVDSLKNDLRRSRSGLGRRIYLVLIAGLLLLALDFAFGSVLFLRSEGLVVQPRIIVSSNHEALVEALFVRPGEAVGEGQLIARVHSGPVVERLAQYSTQMFSHRSQLAELELRRDQLTELLPSAEQRAQDWNERWVRITGMTQSDILPIDRRMDVRGSLLDANDKLAMLNAEAKTIESRVHTLRSAVQRAEDTIADLERTYANGEIRAPAAGIMGPRLRDLGEAISPIEPLGEIYTGERYVVTILPGRYLFSLSPGDRVTVRHGFDSVAGRVEAVLPIAGHVPDEFQRAFRVPEKGQMLRIALPVNTAIPTLARVDIRRPFWPPGEPAAGS